MAIEPSGRLVLLKSLPERLIARAAIGRPRQLGFSPLKPEAVILGDGGHDAARNNPDFILHRPTHLGIISSGATAGAASFERRK